MGTNEKTPLEALRDKIDCEGGLLPALEYGIKAQDIPEEYMELRTMLMYVRDSFDLLSDKGDAFERRLQEAIDAASPE